MTSEEYYNRDKTYSYKAVYYSMIAMAIIILILMIF